MENRESEKKTHKARSRIVLCFLIPAVLLFVIYKVFPARQQNQRTGSRRREDVTVGKEETKGFTNGNILHSKTRGDIHYSSYVPEDYNGEEPYALFITLPGWEGLLFQGVGANMAEDFGVEAIKYNRKMIVLSLQLHDWGKESAKDVIALTEYFLEQYNIDADKVYLHGMSGGGETGSLVMGMRPELYTAYLMTSSKWTGDLETLAASRRPVYLAIGENDSYYGSSSLKGMYKEMVDRYESQGLTEEEIRQLILLDVKEDEYFSSRGFSDQHAGGQAFARDETIMGWLFGEHRRR